MEASFPDLLEALGEVFLVPGAPGKAWDTFAKAAWATPELEQGLEILAGGPWEDLDVAYAGLFLAGFRQPTIHLELSAARSGRLMDEDVLGELEGLFQAAGVHPDPAVPADHLGVLLILLGHLLRLAGQGDQEAAARTLLRDHLAPLGSQVASRLTLDGVHPFYAAAGRTLEAATDLCGRLLG